METKIPLLGENNNDNSATGALIRQLFDRIEKLEHGSGPVELTDSRFPGFVGFCFVSDHDHYSLLW
jgi:hypothetical protein